VFSRGSACRCLSDDDGGNICACPASIGERKAARLGRRAACCIDGRVRVLIGAKAGDKVGAPMRTGLAKPRDLVGGDELDDAQIVVRHLAEDANAIIFEIESS